VTPFRDLVFDDLDIRYQDYDLEWPSKGFNRRSLCVKKLLIKNVLWIKQNFCHLEIEWTWVRSFEVERVGGEAKLSPILFMQSEIHLISLLIYGTKIYNCFIYIDLWLSTWSKIHLPLFTEKNGVYNCFDPYEFAKLFVVRSILHPPAYRAKRGLRIFSFLVIFSSVSLYEMKRRVYFLTPCIFKK